MSSPCFDRHGHLFWCDMCSHDDAKGTAFSLRCQILCRVRGVSQVRKRGAAGGWRASHARDDDIILPGVDEKV